MAHDTPIVFGELGNPTGRTGSLCLQTENRALGLFHKVDPLWPHHLMRVVLLAPR